MNTVYKYELNRPHQMNGITKLQLPIDYSPLTVAMQDGSLCLWAVVDTEDELAETEFLVYATGQPIPDYDASTNFVGTVFDGPFVWHVFERLYE